MCLPELRHIRQIRNSCDARLMHGTDFHGEFRSVSHSAHCDGLVLVPTKTKVYLFNPATRDTMTLPKSNRSKIQTPRRIFLPVGFGLDPRTGRYKVVRVFVRSSDPLTDVYRMGMEVFIIGEAAASWRETAADSPYPVAERITAKFVNGGLIWAIDRSRIESDPNGLVRLSLEDDTFSVIRLPDMLLSLDPAFDDSFLLDLMHGELCLTAFTRSGVELRIWMLVEDDSADSRWEERYLLSITDMIQAMAFLPGGAIMVRGGQNLYRYELQTLKPKLTNVCALEGLRYECRSARTAGQNISFVNIIPYIEILARIIA